MVVGTSPICLAVSNQELPLNEQKINALVADQMVTVREIIAQHGIRHNAMQEMVKYLGYQKHCCHWVPLLMMEENKRA
jgi:hypothetical protein